MHNPDISIQAHFDQVVTAIAEIKEHNKNFGGGAYLGGAIADFLLTRLREDTESSKENLLHQHSAEASVQEIFNCYRTAIKRAGLGLIADKDNSVRLILNDVHKASTFVSQIPRNTFTAEVAEEFAKTIEPVLIHFADIKAFEDVSDTGAEIRYLCELLASRGAGPAIEPSYTLLRALNGGYLNEQIKVDRSKILKNSAFGPSQWHLDSAPESLYKKWTGAIETIREIKENPRAIDLTERVLFVLATGLESFERSLNSWREDERSFPYQKAQLSRYAGVARLVRADFDDLVVQL